MPSFTNWFAVLSAISAPLVATAQSVIDTQAVASGVSDPASTIQSVAVGSLVSDGFALSESIADAVELSAEQEHEHGRSLLARRRRGTSRASPTKKKGTSKKKPSKKKSSKKKPSKKKPSKKKPSRKTSSKKKPSKKKSPGKRATIGSSPRKAKGSGKTIGAAKKAHGTHFSGMGTPTGGCGVPPRKAYDDNGTPLPFVALNTNSEFDNGGNCGRWIEIRLGTNCEGAGNTAFSICNGGKWVSDGLTGKVIYGHVMDSCADNNFWCQDDTFHLDISRSYLTGMGLTSGKNWNGREVIWQYMTGAPPGWKMSNPKFMWKSGTKWIPNGKGFYGAVIIYNTSNGIGGVRQKVGSKWVNIKPLQHLGNMWVVQRPPDSEYRSPGGGSGKSITLMVLDSQGSAYGQYSVKWTCGSGVCSKEVDASAKKVG